jgi:hypothetical protein
MRLTVSSKYVTQFDFDHLRIWWTGALSARQVVPFYTKNFTLGFKHDGEWVRVCRALEGGGGGEKNTAMPDLPHKTGCHVLALFS